MLSRYEPPGDCVQRCDGASRSEAGPEVVPGSLTASRRCRPRSGQKGLSVLFRTVATSHVNIEQYEFLSSHSHMLLVTVVLDSGGIEHFHRHRSSV